VPQANHSRSQAGWSSPTFGWAALTACAAAAGLAAPAIGRWIAGTAAGSSQALANRIPMAPSTAWVVVASALALAIAVRAKGGRVSLLSLAAAAGVDALTAFVVLGRELLDELAQNYRAFPISMKDRLGVPVGQMSPITAELLLLLAAALLFLAPRGKPPVRLAWILPVIGMGFSGIIVLGYLAGAPLFYHSGIVPVALSTALALAALNAAVVIAAGYPERVAAALFGADEAYPAGARAKEGAWIPAAITAGLIVGVIAGGGWYLHSYRHHEEEQLQRELTALAEFKRDELADWRGAQMRTGRLMTRAPYLLSLLHQSAAAIHQSPNAAEVQRWVQHLRATENYAAVVLFDANANVVCSDPETALANDAGALDEVRTSLANGEIGFHDIHGTGGEALHLDLVVPIRDGVSSQPLGASLLQIDPTPYLFPLLRVWPSWTVSGETNLVRREGSELIYFDLRSANGSPLLLRRPLSDSRLLAARVLRGERHFIGDAIDFHANPVVGIGRPVPNTPWALIAAMNHAEAYAPMRRHALSVILTVSALCCAIMLGAGLAWRQRRVQWLRAELGVQREREILNKRLTLVTENANDAILVLTEDGRILEANPRAVTMYGYALAELRGMSLANLRAPASRDAIPEQLKMTGTETGGLFETLHLCRDGSVLPVEVNSRLVEIDGQRLRFSVIRDIRQRKAHEAQIERLNRLYMALCRINQAIVTSRTRGELFASVCRALVETGGIKMVWVGCINAATHEVEPVADFGDTCGYLKSIRIFADDRPEGRGPTGTAIREARVYVCNDFLGDPRTAPWREAAARNGFRASLSLPFSQGSKIVGAVTVYAEVPHVFGAGEVRVCQEATDALSFALERLEADDRQREMDERLRTAFQTGPDAYVIVGRADGRFLEVNDRMLELYGYTRDELIGRTSLELGLWANPGDRDRMLAELNATGKVRNFEVLGRRKNGETFHVSYSISLLSSPGTPIFLGVLTDITETKRAVEELRASETRFRTLIEHAPLAVGLSRDTRTIYVNRKYRELFGIPPHIPVIGESIIGRWTPEYRTILAEYSRRRAKGEPAPSEYEAVALRSNGEQFPVHVAVTTVQLHDGPAAVAFFVDLTEIRRAQEALRQAEEDYRKIYERALEGIYRSSADGRALGANPALLRLLGYSSLEEYLTTVNDSARQIWKDPAARAFYVAKLEREGEIRGAECELLRRDGSSIWAALSGRRVAGPDGRTLYYEGFVQDITERRRADEVIRASEERYRRMVETAQEGVFMYDAAWTLAFANRRFAEILGYTREELLGRPIADIILESDRPAHAARKARQTMGAAGVYENAYRGKDGHPVWCLVSVSPIINDGVFAGSFGMLTDITERKRAERRMAEYQLRLHDLTQHLQQIREEESLRIARVVHDELGQQLTGLKMDLRLVERGLEKVAAPEAAPLLEKVISATDLLDATVVTVQQIAAELRPSLLDKLGLFAALRHESEQFRERSGLGCRFIAPEPSPTLPQNLAISCYRIVQEALTNVVRHARAQNVEITFIVRPDAYELTVCDDGCGIAPEAINDVGSLGLLGMQERAFPLGGEVTVEPGREGGTRVKAVFPQTESGRSPT
jgi:PAS domain S-box-containing protein